MILPQGLNSNPDIGNLYSIYFHMGKLTIFASLDSKAILV